MSTDACTPNISSAGVRMRRRVAIGVGVATLALDGLLLYSHAPVWQIVFVFPAAAVAAVSWFQAERRVCVAHASKGTFEHEDFSTTPVASESMAEITRAAAGIRRDGALVAAGVTALSMGLALLL